VARWLSPTTSRKSCENPAPLSDEPWRATGFGRKLGFGGCVITIATIRAGILATLAAGLFTGCWEPEFSADELNAQGPALAPPVTDGCLERWRFPDEVELMVDFETMVSAADGFRLRQIPGYLHSGPGTAGVFIRPGHEDLSARSLLLFGNRGHGFVGLHWWGCLNVSTRRGIRFWAKGVGSSSVQPDPPKAPAEGECVPQLTLDPTEDWRMYEYTWESFCPVEQAPAFAQRIAGIQFFVQSTAAEAWLAIDDVSFFD
jgi:hypothetical protein